MVHSNANPEQGIHLLLSLHLCAVKYIILQHAAVSAHTLQNISYLQRLRAEAGEAEGDFLHELLISVSVKVQRSRNSSFSL